MQTLVNKEPLEGSAQCWPKATLPSSFPLLSLPIVSVLAFFFGWQRGGAFFGDTQVENQER